MIPPNCWATDPFGTRAPSCEVASQGCLHLQLLERAQEQAQGADCMLMNWRTFEALSVAYGMHAHEIYRRKNPTLFYRGLRAVVVEDYPHGVIDFAQWAEPEGGVRLRFNVGES